MGVSRPAVIHVVISLPSGLWDLWVSCQAFHGVQGAVCEDILHSQSTALLLLIPPSEKASMSKREAVAALRVHG